MIDDLIAGIKGQIADKLQQEEGVSSNQVDGIMDVIKNVSQEKIGGELLGGNLSGVMNLFSDQPNTQEADSLQTNLTSGIMEGLIGKLGIDRSKASSIVNTVVPILIGFLTKKNNETAEDDASPLTDLLGGSGGGLGDIAKNALGGLFGK